MAVIAWTSGIHVGDLSFVGAQLAGDGALKTAIASELGSYKGGALKTAIASKLGSYKGGGLKTAIASELGSYKGGAITGAALTRT